jgi:CelD/BcsL family acetyltransferase involved in cellulose biosynthesis
LIQRAVIPVDQVPDDCLGTLYSKSRRKTLKRNRRRLESYGSVEFRLHRPEPGDSRAVEEFLRLESLGWKGDQGTAMATDANHARFCRELVTGFAARGQVIFGELTVDDRPVASTLNLLSGESLFAFKIGWDPEFAECSPGTLSELNLLEHCHEVPGLNQIDSCAKPGSYVENVWPWRRKLTTGVFTTSMTGTLAASALSRVKQIKRLLRRT